MGSPQALPIRGHLCPQRLHTTRKTRLLVNSPYSLEFGVDDYDSPLRPWHYGSRPLYLHLQWRARRARVDRKQSGVTWGISRICEVRVVVKGLGRRVLEHKIFAEGCGAIVDAIANNVGDLRLYPIVYIFILYRRNCTIPRILRGSPLDLEGTSD